MSSHTPGPAAKRRRVDAANATLKKPFRSPMINRPSASTSGPDTTTPSSTKPTKALPGTTPARRSSLAAGLLTTPTPSTTNETSPTRRPTPAFTTPSTRKSTNVPRSASPSTISPTIARPQQNPHLQTDEDPAIIEQALKITREAAARRPGEPVDAELKEATAKWRAAGRLAAEDLFELVKSRVEGMGREERKGRSGWGDDDDFGREKRKERRNEGGNEGSSHDNGSDYERDQDEVEGCSQGGGSQEGEKQKGGEDEGFTMLTMLRSLNIEPEILGFDPVEDKWKD